MRVPSLHATGVIVLGGLLVALVMSPAPTLAQCSMMGGGGGHDHAAMQKSRDAKPTGADRKLRQSIDRLLTDERGRSLLTDALLEDRAFMESLVRRLALVPELRAMASQQLAAPFPAGERRTDAPGGPAVAEAVFACPMHPDVTSSQPGDCPRCGMALVRRDARRE